MTWVDRDRRSGPDRLLWAFILRRAVYDYVLYKDNPRQRRLWMDSAFYIFGPQGLAEAGADEDYRPESRLELTFDEVCELFDWDPDFIRRLTKEFDKREIRKIETSRLMEDMDISDARIEVERLRWASGLIVSPLLPTRYPDYLFEVEFH